VPCALGIHREEVRVKRKGGGGGEGEERKGTERHIRGKWKRIQGKVNSNEKEKKDIGKERKKQTLWRWRRKVAMTHASCGTTSAPAHALAPNHHHLLHPYPCLHFDRSA
jgi:hypothetical protein